MPTPERTAYLVEPGWSADVTLGGFVRLLTYPDGRQRIEHPCRVVDGTRLVIAPLLHEQHVVTGPADAPTVRPSVLCPDCGLHGFVTSGQWADC